MKRQRQPKKLTAKELQTRNNVLESRNAMLKLDIRERTANFMTQLQIFEGILRAALDSAGTIGEARRRYDEWAKDINAIPIDDLDHNNQIAAVLQKHGIEIKINDHHTQVDQMWQQSREKNNAPTP